MRSRGICFHISPHSWLSTFSWRSQISTRHACPISPNTLSLVQASIIGTSRSFKHLKPQQNELWVELCLNRLPWQASFRLAVKMQGSLQECLRWDLLGNHVDYWLSRAHLWINGTQLHCSWIRERLDEVKVPSTRRKSPSREHLEPPQYTLWTVDSFSQRWVSCPRCRKHCHFHHQSSSSSP